MTILEESTVSFSNLDISNVSLSYVDQGNECIICSNPYDAQHTPLRLSCCNQLIGHKCFSKYVLDRKRNFLKHNQSLLDFSVVCLFCKGTPEFKIDTTVCEGSLLSTPSTIGHYQSSEIEASQEESFSCDRLFCLKCYAPIDDIDAAKTCLCCNKVFHSECAEAIQEELKNIKAYQVLRGFNCGNCTIDKHMLQESLVYVLETEVSMKTPHMLACVPDCNYLLSVLMSYTCGANYNKGNPWKAQELISKYPEMKTFSQRILSLLSKDDIDHFRNDILRNLKNLRNVFVPSSTLNEFLSRDPTLNKEVLELCYKIYVDACSIYSSTHVHGLKKIHDNIIDSIIGVQGYMVRCVFTLYYMLY